MPKKLKPLAPVVKGRKKATASVIATLLKDKAWLADIHHNLRDTQGLERR